MTSGVLEMDGFKETFSVLFNSSEGEVALKTTLLLKNYSIDNSSSFCGSSSGVASSCGTGDGAGSNSQIVSWLHQQCSIITV